MKKLIEINGCIEIPENVETEFVIDEFVTFVENRGWTFGGGFQTIIDDWYVNNEGEKVKRIHK